MKRATGYSLRIEGGRYYWDHYGPMPKMGQVSTRLFPEAGLYYGPPGRPGFRLPLNADPCGMKSRYEYGTIYLLDGYAASIHEFADGSSDISIDAGMTYFSENGESTLSFKVHANSADYPALEKKIAAVLHTVRQHPDYLPRINMPKGLAVTKRRGQRWFESSLVASG